VKSAGIVEHQSEINDEVVHCAQSEGLIISRVSQLITEDLLDWAEKIIVVADDVPIEVLGEKNKHKLVLWSVPDVENGDVEGRISTIKVIKQKIDVLSRTNRS